MTGFTYEAPTTVDDAVGLLAASGAHALAGGTDLLVQIKGGVRHPERVIDLKRIPELLALELGDESITIGAAVSCWALSRRDDLRALLPGMMEAAELIGSMQIQGRASLGGNLCNGSPAADTAPALIAASAVALIAGPTGRRELPVESLFTGPGTTALDPAELLIALRIPRPGSRSADAYLRFTPRAEMDIAVAGAGAMLSIDPDGLCSAARIALGAVAATPILVPAAAEAVIGTRLEEDALGNAGDRASEAASPISDKRGSADYRRRLAAVLTRRALSSAAERARGRS